MAYFWLIIFIFLEYRFHLIWKLVYLCINLIKYCLYCRQKTRSRSKSRKKENDRPKHKIIMKDKESSDGTINKKKDSSVHQKTSKKSGTQCPCLLSAPDKIHLICKHCGNVDHATCYDILTTGDFKHTCGPCSVKLNLPCTSERMSNFYRKGVYQKEACKQMSRKLTRQSLNFVCRQRLRKVYWIRRLFWEIFDNKVQDTRNSSCRYSC